MKDNYMEINVSYAEGVVRGLLKSGYQVMLWQDGESDDVVGIEYVHPEYDGVRFRACECTGYCSNCEKSEFEDEDNRSDSECDNCEKCDSNWESNYSKFAD